MTKGSGMRRKPKGLHLPKKCFLEALQGLRQGAKSQAYSSYLSEAFQEG